ncbi:NYN domain-containing protein [Clostridium sp. SYSU_GA19001]|uniref:NYN domain-containing protein n=1 Tax=Clostridium caldaquaticum TaxID=2940653 RepID=UPI002076D69F|nr:NYN domain-containing protein [Clostridium caldaquaticum]
MRNIFVDGYNVINTWPELRGMKEYSLEAARGKLIDYLQNYATYKGYRVFIVFDAHMVSGSLEKKEKISDSITVVYTKEGETADSFIERAVNNIGRRVEVSVITSDSLEQQTAFQRGATRMSSMEFYFEVKETEDKIRARANKNYSEKRNLLEDRIQKDVLEKLDKIRRSR